MTDMQTSLLLLIVRPSILNLVINFSTHLWPMKWNALVYTFALRISISSPLMLMQHMHQHDQQWYDLLHIIMWPYWFIDLDLTCSSPLLRSISAKFFSSFPATWIIASKPPTCPSRSRLVHQAKPCLDLLHLAIWLHVMSHMQWAPSSHVWALQQIKAIFTVMAWVTHTSVPVD